jgi:hypothetical protein
MTDDELFTAIYLVCGALPAVPEKQRHVTKMAVMYRRSLGNGVYQSWLVDEDIERSGNYDVRITHDPAYIELFDKAARFGITMEQFSAYIAWAEAHEQRGQKI